MHWRDEEIVVVEISGRFFALNGWDGENYAKCWECTARDGDKFERAVGFATYTISRVCGELKFSPNNARQSPKERMYKCLLPYSGAANTICGEMLRACDAIARQSSVRGAIAFLELNLVDETAREILREFKRGNFDKFELFRQIIEQIAMEKFEKNDLEANESDFEEMG